MGNNKKFTDKKHEKKRTLVYKTVKGIKKTKPPKQNEPRETPNLNSEADGGTTDE